MKQVLILIVGLLTLAIIGLGAVYAVESVNTPQFGFVSVMVAGFSIISLSGFGGIVAIFCKDLK